jgi:hypothetical protein
MKLVRNPSFNGKPDAGNPHVRFDEGENVGGHWQCLSSRGVLSTLLFSGAPSEAWQNLQIERYLPYELTIA